MTRKDEEARVQEFVMPGQAGRTQWRQWLACITATLSMVAVGTVYGWATTCLSRLKSGDPKIVITEAETSWIVPLTVIGSMIGPFIGAGLADSIGRKKTLLISSLFYITGWIITICAKQSTALYIARLVLGIGVGISYTTNPMYVSEIADVNIRGALGTLIAVNVFTGSLIACSIGPWIDIQHLTIILLVIPIIFLGTFSWLPESPYYLVTKSRYAEASRAISFFKGIQDETELREELDLIVKSISENADTQRWRDKIPQLMLPNNLKALAIVLGLIVTQQLSGNFTTMAYLEVLFAEANTGIDSNLATIIVFAFALVFGAIATSTVERAGRRPLLLISTLGSALSLGVLGIYLYLQYMKYEVKFIGWLAVVDVILFQLAYQVGLGSLPNALIGELFPTNVKGIAGATITITDGMLGFVVSKVVGDSVNNYLVYLFFAASCLAAFFFVLGVIPETKGKSFSEIQDELADNRLRCHRRRSKI